MKLGYTIVIFLFFVLSGCGLLYPPQYYSDLIEKSSSSGSSGGETKPFVAWTSNSTGAATLSGVVFTNINSVFAVGPAMFHYQSTDGGKTWASINASSMTGSQNSIAWDGTYLLASGSMGLYYYVGGTWQIIISSLAFNQIITVPGYHMAAGNAGNQIYYTAAFPSGWAYPTTQPSSAIYGVCLNSVLNQFFAVSSSGNIYTSATGNPDSWGVAANPGTALYSIACGSAAMVAVGASGKIYYCPIGSSTSWTDVSYSGNLNNLNRVIWTGFLFIAVGDSGTLLASPNGMTWVPFATGLTIVENLKDIAYYNGKMIVVGDAGTAYVSP